MDQMKDNNRQSNFELLRIVLMLLIIAGHVTMYSGKLKDLGTTDYYLTNFLRSFTMVAVNAFVLLTGYFGTKRNWKKLMKLDLRVCFYTWVGFALAVTFGIHTINATKDIQLLFPVISKQYWYTTIYFVLCIFSPYLNVFLENVSEKMLKDAIYIGGGVLYIVATFCFLINANQIVMDAGYGIVNFVYLYCLGYYIRHYYVDRHGAAFYIGMYLLACLSTFAVNEGMSRIMGFYFNSMISYNTIFTLVGSIGLFMCFKHLETKKNRFITWLAKHSFSVYLIHMCPMVGSYLFTTLLGVNNVGGANLIVKILCLPFGIYFVSAVIDSAVDYLLTPIQGICLKVLSKVEKKT